MTSSASPLSPSQEEPLPVDTKAPLHALLDQMDPKLIPVVISVGTYSSCVAGFLFPLDLEKDISAPAAMVDENNEEEDLADQEEMMFQIYSTKAHDGSVDTFATHGTYCFSASSDETVCMFDMKKNVQEGSIKVARGPITKMCMINAFRDFIVASGTNLTLFSQVTPKGHFEVLWQADNAHKKPIMDMDVHPSGRALLTVAADGRLKMWNLLTGQMDFETHLESRADCVRWSPEGKSFSFSRRDTLLVHSAETAQELIQLKHESQITTIQYLNEYLLAVGFRNGEIRIYDIAERALVHQITEVHQSRVKGICVQEINVMEFLMVSVSSDGVVAVFRIKEDAAQLQCIQNLDTRVQCVAMNFLKNVTRRVKKRYILLEKLREKAEKEGSNEEQEEAEEEESAPVATVEEVDSEEEKPKKKRKREASPEKKKKKAKKSKKKKAKKSKKKKHSSEE